MFEFLARIGTASATAFWVPVLVWTGLAGAVALSLALARGLHPMMGYRLRQALLLALPASVLAAPWIPAPWLPTRGLLRPDLPTTLEPAIALPAIGGAPLGPDPATGADIALALLGAATVGVLLLAVVRLAMLAADLHRLGKLRVTAPRVGDPAPNRLLRTIAGQFGVRRPVELLEGPPESVPMTFGARRPVVVVPRLLLDSPESLKMVLAHELIHIRRADYVWALLDCLTAALFAFHPLIRLLRRGIERCRETSCDAEVVAAEIVRPREYAELLVRTQTPAQFPMPAVAASMSARTVTLKERLETMKNFADTRPTSLQRRGAVLGAGVLFLVIASLGACVGGNGRDVPEQDEFAVPAVVEGVDTLMFRYLRPLVATGVSGAEYYQHQPTSEQEMLDELTRLDVQMEYLRERMDEIRKGWQQAEETRNALGERSQEARDLGREISDAQLRVTLLRTMRMDRLKRSETVKLEFETRKRMQSGL